MPGKIRPPVLVLDLRAKLPSSPVYGDQNRRLTRLFRSVAVAQ